MSKQKQAPKEKTYVQKVKLYMVKEETSQLETRINWPSHVAKLKLIEKELIKSDREKFICLHLDTRNRVISYEVVAIGSLNQVIVHPREVFKGAILSNAQSVILCHNHPSGDVKPSKQDIELTKRVKYAGNILGIEVIDHMIFGNEKSFLSMKEKDLL